MEYWYLTHPGCVRTMNQDACYAEQLDKNTLLCVVCDGMGGAKAGNVASSLAIEVFAQELKNSYSPDLNGDKLKNVLENAIKLANFTVYDQAQQFEEFAGMGTTLAAVLIRGREVTAVNVGDSRVYRINEDGITQITRDHSVVQMMVDRNEMTSEQAKNYPGKNLITRAIGTETMVTCDIFNQKLQKGEHLLLCTDGLSNLLSDQELLFEVLHGGETAGCCQRLLDIAIKRGAPDNVTSVLVAV